MTSNARAIALLALLLPAVVSAAAESQRPRIGLVLAGGGAKGGAHIGALKVLEELHVPIDCIAGTSIGALVGAGYATGQPAAEIEKFVTGIDWAAVIGGVGRRTLEPIEQKRLAIDAGSKVQMGLIDGKIVTPSGLADASSIDDLLRSYVARARTVSDFNKLPIPFRAVATDMMTGDMVVLDHGDIATAMRASMAIPGAFSPVVLDPWILSDGGMVRNIPIDVARNTCADIVIVVNLVEPAPTREKLVQAQQLLSRSMDVMFEVNEKAQLASADRPRHPHQRPHGRHHDGRLRPHAGDHPARRDCRAQGRGSPCNACVARAGVHGLAQRGHDHRGHRGQSR